MNCQKCGTQLPESDGAGRPKKFCSKSCRRAAEYEITRIHRLLGDLEQELSSYRMYVSSGDESYVMAYNCKPKKAIRIVEKELKLQEKRMLELLEEDKK
ncbi:MAG: hypothetical protein E2P05_00560 [Acidobacteria bacterium]|nr:MAG: hypothetical protein E2P05_00560 [Acidobacteriota bacterium]